MKFNEIKELIELAEKSSLTHIEVKDKDFHLILGREKETVIAQGPVGSAPVAQVVPQPEQGHTEEKKEEKLTGSIIKSPMVGTFYSKASPDAKPFVKVGDQVKKGDTVCILEAMKLMNEIESTVDGKVVKVLAIDEEMVEYGQPLFEIEV